MDKVLEKNTMNSGIKILSLFLFLAVITACAGYGPAPAASATISASPTPDYWLTYPPTATVTATATRTPTRAPTFTYIASSLPTCTPVPPGLVYVIDEGVYNDVEPGIEMGVWEAIDVLQGALERRAPVWAQYRWRDSKGKEHSLAEYIWDVSSAQRIGVNPRVLLVTAGMALDWQVPKGKDLLRAISEVGVTLTEHYHAFLFDEALRARYPQVANAASYALYAFFDYNMEKLHAWQQIYQNLFGHDALSLAAAPIPNAFPRPFMARPFAQPPVPTLFYTIYSFLDHNAPYRYSEGTLTRFDGQVLAGTRDNCDAGKSCYSGHEGLDYTTGRAYPAIRPPIYAVADGVVSKVFRPCGQVEVLHEDEQVVSVYMHMEDIQVTRNQRVEAGTLLGYTGNVADGTNCFSSGAHLHFHILSL